MKFSEYLWSKMSRVFEEIAEHPFNVELSNGELNEERFAFYLSQDAYYMMERSRAFALIANRFDSPIYIEQFLKFAQGSILAEQELHTNFLVPDYDLTVFEPTLACMAYTKYLIAMAATASLEEAVAATLPCFWIYRELGQQLANNTAGNNPYQIWINSYLTEEFLKETDQLIVILDEMASCCSKSGLLKMEKAFEQGMRLEWHFWQDAYEMKTIAHTKNALHLPV